MALNFPLNPTVGQQYAYPPFIYEWDGDKWVTITSPTSAADELREDLAANTGAVLVGTSTGQTVQYELDNHTHTPTEVGALPVDGTAVSASKLSAARSIALTGDVTGSTLFDGTANVSIAATYKNSGVTAGTYKSVTVDAKGNITAGTNPTTLAGYGITDAQASDPTLTAMAGVVTAADKIIYFNGVDTALATTLSAFGRTLIDDADAATARTTLGAAATSHTHAITDVTNLQTELDGKLDTTAKAASATVADSAAKLTTARTITLAGDVTGSVSFDGTVNVSITTAVADDSHAHVIGNIDSLQTSLDAKVAVAGDTMTGDLTTTKVIMTAAQGTGAGDAVRYDYLNGQAPNRTTDIGASKDLNTYQTPGFYFQDADADATSGTNYPLDKSGSLLVQKAAGITQLYIAYGTNYAVYTRGFYSNTWSNWSRFYTTDFKPTATDVGLSYISQNAQGLRVTLNGKYVDIGCRNTTYCHMDTDATSGFYMYKNLDAPDVYIRSDIRLKSGLTKLNSALDKVDQLTGYTYNKKQDLTSQITRREAGLIAQDLQKVLPEAVNTSDTEDQLLSISNSGVNALLVEAIKELNKENKHLKSIIEYLELELAEVKQIIRGRTWL